MGLNRFSPFLLTATVLSLENKQRNKGVWKKAVLPQKAQDISFSAQDLLGNDVSSTVFANPLL